MTDVEARLILENQRTIMQALLCIVENNIDGKHHQIRNLSHDILKTKAHLTVMREQKI